MAFALGCARGNRSRLDGNRRRKRVGTSLRNPGARKSDRAADESQLPLFIDPAQQLRAALASLKIDALTPLQAFELLREWKEKLGK